MRALRVLLLTVIVGLSVLPVFAQDQGREAPVITALTVQVQRVYPHRLGYKVTYDRSDVSQGTVYLPNRWFTGAAAQAEMVFTRHPAAPYMTLYYFDGEFSHLRLVVQSDRSNVMWGALSTGENIDDQFSRETLEFRY